MHKRDGEIVDMLIESKKKYNYPEKFRTCWGKNTDDKIFVLAAKLHKYDMEKGITLARQSNSKPVLANIKRGNIKLSSYAALQRRFNDLDVPVYTEMILGLPGESYESWRDGIEQILQSGLKNQLFVYQCEVYPNTEMGDPDYQRRFGIETLRTELREIHGSVRNQDWVTEYQDIIVASHSMTNSDWRRMTKLATMTMLLHSMKLGFYVLGWISERFDLPHIGLIEFISEARLGLDAAPILRGELAYLESYLDAMMAGAGRGCVLSDYLDIYWDIEEALFIRIAEKLDAFFREFEDVVRQYLDSEGVTYNGEEVSEVMRYQRLRIPSAASERGRTERFSFNVPEYFDHLFSTDIIPLVGERQDMVTQPIDYKGDKARFVRETILWGRKSGTLIVKCAWNSLERADSSSEIVESLRAERARTILANWPSASVANMAS
jgi:putative methyltransferase